MNRSEWFGRASQFFCWLADHCFSSCSCSCSCGVRVVGLLEAHRKSGSLPFLMTNAQPELLSSLSRIEVPQWVFRDPGVPLIEARDSGF